MYLDTRYMHQDRYSRCERRESSQVKTAATRAINLGSPLLAAARDIAQAGTFQLFTTSLHYGRNNCFPLLLTVAYDNNLL